MVNLDTQWLDTLAATHSFLKIALFMLVWAIAWLPIAVPIAWLVKWNPAKPLTEKQKLILLASLYLIAPAIVWLAAQSEGTPWQDYGLAWQPHLLVSLVLGTSVGLVSLLVIFACQGWLGWVQWHFKSLTWSSVLLLAIGLGVGFIEELIFRGFVLYELQPSYGRAAALSSLIFAGSHLVWDKQLLPQLPGLWLMGMVLAEARIVDGGSLGLAWGLHAGWIWGLSTLDGSELVTYTEKVPAWITGFGKQPLAGMVGIVGLLAMGGGLFYFSQL